MHHPEPMDKPNFFEAGSPYLDHPLLTAERTQGELDFILAELDLAAGARVLDVGCGFGRHSVALAQRGFLVTGIDPAQAMISAAQARVTASNVAVDFQAATVDQMKTGQPFDAAICLFTTLGQISNGGDNRGLVPQVYARLKPGGHFIVEIPQRDPAIQALKPAEQFGAGNRYTAVQRQYDPGDHSVIEVFRRVDPGGSESFLLSYRLYSQAELSGMLTQAGFKVTAVYGNYEGSPLSPESAIMLFFAAK